MSDLEFRRETWWVNWWVVLGACRVRDCWVRVIPIPLLKGYHGWKGVVGELVTFGFEARVGEIVRFGFGFADFELGFLVRWLVCWLVGMGGGMDGMGVGTWKSFCFSFFFLELEPMVTTYRLCVSG